MSSSNLDFKTLALSVEAANAARELLDRRLTSATPILESANNNLARADELFRSASQEPDEANRDRILADANKVSQDALDSARQAMCTLSRRGPPIDEWKECRATIDRFDKILVDLRKTGFGFVTALVSAVAFLFNDQTEPRIKVSIFAILTLLVITLYAIDLVHQVWLRQTVNKARDLEVMLGFELSRAISAKFKKLDAAILGVALYVCLLAAAGWVFIAAITHENMAGGHHVTIFVIAAIGTIVIGGSAWRYLLRD
jgi:hypothetical protein